MHKIDGYIMRSVGGAILLVMIVVLSLDLIFAFIGELEDKRNNYSSLDALYYVGMTLPRRIYDYLPLGAFMGCLIGLGTLASTSELTVIRAAGISIRRIVWSAMKPALVVILIGLAVGEYLVPDFERAAQSHKAISRGAAQNVASPEGLWHRSEDTYIHVNAVTPDGTLVGLFLFDYGDDHWLDSAAFAERAIYENDHWVLHNLTRTIITPEGTSLEKMNEEIWETGLTPGVLSVLIVDPEDLPMAGLYTYARYLGDQGLQAGAYWLAFWKKLLMPLSTGVMVVVAISFIFGPLRSVTMGFRIFVGLIVGLLFKYMQDFLGPMSLVYGFNPILAIVIPIALNGLFGAYLLRRAG